MIMVSVATGELIVYALQLAVGSVFLTASIPKLIDTELFERQSLATPSCRSDSCPCWRLSWPFWKAPWLLR